MKISSKLQLVVLIVFILIAASAVVFTSRTTSSTTTSTSTYAAGSGISLEGYCKDGYYEIPGEDRCSRAPNCGGFGYDEVDGKSAPNPQKCMGDGAGRESKGCAGYVPVCCYEVARTGDFTKCVGYWERLWCAPVQCREAESNGANQGQCGGSCDCGHAFGEYCGDKAVVPLTQRLGIQQPTNTPVPTNAPPIPTNTSVPPQPTHTTAPNQPTNTPPPTNTPVPYAPTSAPNNGVPTSPPSANQPIGIQPSPHVIQQKNPLPELPSKQEVVASLETTTAKPLSVVDTSYDVVVSADQQLEAFAESWIDRIRAVLLNILK